MRKNFLVPIWLFLVISFSTSTCFAGDFLGEFCWNFQPSGTPFSFPMKLGITQNSPTHYSAQGVITVPGENPMILSGGLVINGNNVLMNLTTTHDHHPQEGWRDSGIMQINLDLSSLSGSGWQIRTDYNTSTSEFDQAYRGSTLTFTSCP